MTTARWLHGANIVTATGNDPEAKGLLVEHGRITRIGGRPPTDAEVIDCTGLTVTPGLIDAHVHLGLSSALEPSLNHGTSVAELAADMFANCAQTLQAGFTTVRDCGGIDAGLVRAVSSGKVAGPRIVACGPVHCQTGGHGHFAPDWEPSSLWCARDVPGLRTFSMLSDGPDQLRKNARESFRRGAQFLKLCVTGGVLSKYDELTDTQFTIGEIAVAVTEASARGSYVTVHAHNVEGVRNAVTAGVRCIEHGTGIDDETAAMMATHDVALVPTLTVLDAVVSHPSVFPAEIVARATAVRDGMVAGLLAAKSAGVRVGLGSDLLGPDQTRRGQELVLRAAIETPMEALVAATRTNAHILRLGDEIGTLEEGKRGDIVAFDGDPLENPQIFADPSRVLLVLKDGVVVKDKRD